MFKHSPHDRCLTTHHAMHHTLLNMAVVRPRSRAHVRHAIPSVATVACALCNAVLHRATASHTLAARLHHMTTAERTIGTQAQRDHCRTRALHTYTQHGHSTVHTIRTVTQADHWRTTVPRTRYERYAAWPRPRTHDLHRYARLPTPDHGRARTDSLYTHVCHGAATAAHTLFTDTRDDHCRAHTTCRHTQHGQGRDCMPHMIT